MTALETIREVKDQMRVIIRKAGYGELQGQASALIRDKNTYSLYLDSKVKKITYKNTIYIEVE